MILNKTFSTRIGFSVFTLVSCLRFATRSLLALVFICLPDYTHAQGNFVPASNSQSNYPNWNPPDSQPAGNFAASGERSDAPGGFSFPQAPVAFDPGVRTANLEVALPENQTRVSSANSTIDSTATMLSNLKDATTDKLSGMAATLKQDGGWTEKIRSLSGSTDIGRMLGSLTLVLGIYFAFVWVIRKFNPAGNAGLPPEVIEVMGQVPFGPKRNLQLVRLGSKLLLLINSPEGTQSIGEITDPDEVQHLTSLCPGRRKTGIGAYASIQTAAARLAAVRSTPPTPVSTPSPAPAPTHTVNNNSNLANILRSLDQAVRQNTTSFEA